ncbi:MAG: polyphosphate kinase 1 [Spirochaeta sp. LUC14_002_19_P3]|nr:MAG: polyphosphate kinase 1 [Spirochaeta sp. LUC14_002_19_P3]
MGFLEVPFIQRELSWNQFNVRVLQEGLRNDTPLLDKLKFIAISSSNYDEFFKVRVARLMREILEGDHPKPPDNERPSEILSELLFSIHETVNTMTMAFTEEILPRLETAGIAILPPHRWQEEETARANRIFHDELICTAAPIAVADADSISEHVIREGIHGLFRLNNGKLAFVSIPENLERFREVPAAPNTRKFILLEDILLSKADDFFPGSSIQTRCLFRITRDADMNVNEQKDEDFITAMEEVLEHRKSSFPVRLETCGDEELANTLRQMISLCKANHFHSAAPPGLKAFHTIASLVGFDHLRCPRPVPSMPQDIGGGEDIWEILKTRDILLHHPYESFAPVIRMVETAAEDPNVLAIKMTLYRTSGDSPIVEALIKAAENGKQVTVLVELKARFDENANINWALRLRKAGAIVIYGLVMLKVHVKALMIVRREETGIHRCVHLGTGNYNDTTAALYTDMGLITAKENYTRDTALMFNAITGYSAQPQLHTLFIAPFTLRQEINRLIQHEIRRAKSGEEAWIMAKMNALTDPQIIDTLYAASTAGVKINLCVRGICCLLPGVKGFSENIRVISIIDNFLEHSRIYCFHGGGNQKVFLSSADWMTRNLDLRVELLFPIADSTHKKRVKTILESCFKDNTHSWELRSNGTWKQNRPKKKDKPFRIQEHLLAAAAQTANNEESTRKQALKVRREEIDLIPNTNPALGL